MTITISENDIELYDISFPASFYFYENRKKIVDYILTVFSENHVSKAIVNSRIADAIFGTFINISTTENIIPVGFLGRTEIFLHVYKNDNIIDVIEIDKFYLRKYKVMKLLKIYKSDDLLEKIIISKTLMDII